MRFRASVTIEQPIHRVFVYSTDPTTWSRWLTTSLQAGWDVQGPVDIGAMLRPVHLRSGSPSTVTWEVTQYEPPRVFACRTICGPTLTIHQLFESVDGVTRLTVSADGDVAWLGEGRLTLALERLRDLLTDADRD